MIGRSAIETGERFRSSGRGRADGIVAEVRKAVDDAAAFADALPAPKPEHGLANVFAEGSVPLHRS